MEELALAFFPYPHLVNGVRKDGVLRAWPERCSACDRQCESAPVGDVELCSYGLNYVRVTDDLLVAGVALKDYSRDTPARSKMLRALRGKTVATAELEAIVARCQTVADAVSAELRSKMDAVIAEYRESKGYQQEIVELLRPDLEKTLGQVHDYKQFVQQIIQNLNVLLEEQFPELPIDEKLERASHQETAMYWTAMIMDERLDAALFLDSPERIHEPREQGQCRLHGLVLKYVRIYQSRADGKKLTTKVVGESWGNIAGNTRALGIIPHTLIDNAIKYAPEGSQVTIGLDESDDNITLSVKSLGPRIKRDEESRIFDLFYRGDEAREKYSEGTGFGLASAQNVARAHGTEIVVEQEANPKSGGAYKTEFRVAFDRASGGRGSRR